jgi:hypothetical protein
MIELGLKATLDIAIELGDSYLTIVEQGGLAPFVSGVRTELRVIDESGKLSELEKKLYTFHVMDKKLADVSESMLPGCEIASKGIDAMHRILRMHTPRVGRKSALENVQAFSAKMQKNPDKKVGIGLAL